MRKEKYLIISLFLVMFLPLHVKAYDCVLTGSDSCSFSVWSASNSSRSCSTSSPLSCNSSSNLRTSTRTYCFSATACATVTTSGYDKSYRISSNGSTCGTQNVTITHSRGVTKSIRFWKAWRLVGSGSYGPFESRKPSKSTVGADACRAYEGESTSVINGKTYYTYSQFWSRCCNSVSSDTPDTGNPGRDPEIPPPPPTPKCYRKVISEQNNQYDYKWRTSSPGAGYSEVSSITNEVDCVLENPSYCTPTSFASNIDGRVTKCDDTVRFDLGDGKKCQLESSSSFYDISCSNHVTISYIPGFSSDTVTLKKGQGFGFKVNYRIEKDCHGTFSESLWNDAYNRVNNLVNRSQDDSERRYYNRIKDEIVNIVTTYNSWVITENDNNVVVNTKFNYKENGVDKNYDQNFVRNGDPVNTVTNKTVSNTRTLANGTRVSDFTNYKLVTDISFEPNNVYIDKRTGEITENVANSISAGKKIFTSLKSDLGIHDLQINMRNIAGNENYTLNNNFCKINIVGDEDLYYRIIDVKNPFLNNTKIGENWYNNEYDYQKVIKENVWSTLPLYQFDLSKEDIVDLKRSNASDTDVYLGTCYKDSDSMTGIDKEICGVIK